MGSRLAYPKSIALDGTPGGELVVALFTPEPLSASIVEKWAAALAAASGNDLEQLAKEISAKPLGTGSSAATLLLKKG